MKTYTIELRAEFEDEEKYDVLLEAVREAARTMLATALMLKEKREPQLALQAGDMFERDVDLKVFKPEDIDGGE